MCNLLHSFWEVHKCVVPFTGHGKLHEFGAEKPVSWGKPAHYDFFAINFTVWSHILSTFGDALTPACLISLGVSAICKRQRISSIHCPLSQLLLPERPYLVGKDSVFFFVFEMTNKKTGTSEIWKAVLVPKWGKLDNISE